MLPTAVPWKAFSVDASKGPSSFLSPAHTAVLAPPNGPLAGGGARIVLVALPWVHNMTADFINSTPCTV